MIGSAKLVVENGILSDLVERAVPSPQPGELLLRIHATSVNFHDLVGIDGGIPGLPLPRVPFSDASATVVSLGDGVTSFSPDDRVIPNFFPNWLRGPISAGVKHPVNGDQIDGTLQTHLCVPANSVVRTPRALTHREAATLGCAALTAWRAIVAEARVQPGQTVVLQGTGGVSLAALAFAKMAGARVIITSSSDEKLERAQALGADVLVNYRSQPEWHKSVLKETDNEGADVVVEVGGGATLAQSVKATKIGGHVSVIGVLSGWDAPEFPLGLVMSRNLHVCGITVGSTAHLNDMCRAIDANGYKPVIDSTFELPNADAAIASMRSQQHFGKIVIDVS
jgi:NADPH:quinone reductase-like Zn-dependent oxidoreductase